MLLPEEPGSGLGQDVNPAGSSRKPPTTLLLHTHTRTRTHELENQYLSEVKGSDTLLSEMEGQQPREALPMHLAAAETLPVCKCGSVIRQPGSGGHGPRFKSWPYHFPCL